jgi:hypothetical protein
MMAFPCGCISVPIHHGHDGHVGTSDVPFNRNAGDRHIGGDFGAGIAGSARKINLSCPPAYSVQYGRKLIQTLLAIEDLFRSRAWGYQRVLSLDVV